MLSALTGLLLGAWHVVSGPDHLAAVTPLVLGPDHEHVVSTSGSFASERKPSRIGLAWGLGHASGVWLVGLVLLGFGSLIPLDLDGSGFLDNWSIPQGIDNPGEFQRFRPFRHRIAETDTPPLDLPPFPVPGANPDPGDNDDDGVLNEIGELGDRNYLSIQQIKGKRVVAVQLPHHQRCCRSID